MQDPRYGMPDAVSAIIWRARSAGVTRLACCSTSEMDWQAVSALSERFPSILPSYGLHPWYIAGKSPDWLRNLRLALLANPAAAVGEIGLDGALRDTGMTGQADVFARQMELAVELDRPVSIHCRQAWDTLPGILEKTGCPAAGFMIHSYSGTPGMIPSLAAYGCRFSFSGAITRPGNRKSADAARAVPESLLLVETDAPDMMPWQGSVKTHGKLNEPVNINCALAKLAGIRGKSVEEIANLTFANACKLFRTS